MRYKKHKRLTQFCFAFKDVSEGARLSFKNCFLWLPEEEPNGAKILEQRGVKNNLNTSIWMLLGSKVAERADRPNIKKFRERTAGSTMGFGLLRYKCRLLKP